MLSEEKDDTEGAEILLLVADRTVVVGRGDTRGRAGRVWRRKSLNSCCQLSIISIKEDSLPGADVSVGELQGMDGAGMFWISSLSTSRSVFTSSSDSESGGLRVLLLRRRRRRS